MADLLRCEWCHEEFERPKRRGPRPRFCRESHRQRAYVQRREERFVDLIEWIVAWNETHPIGWVPDEVVERCRSVLTTAKSTSTTGAP